MMRTIAGEDYLLSYEGNSCASNVFRVKDYVSLLLASLGNEYEHVFIALAILSR